MHDHHHHNHSINEKKLGLSILLNIIITVSEIAGGILSGSLALLSDAFHNLSDVFSLIISYMAVLISRKEKDSSRTFGYKRSEIIAALFNIITLLGACVYIIYQAINRFLHPQPINVGIMLVVTIIGLLGNGLSIFLLIKDAKINLNIKSAFLHLLGDTISSVAVLITALFLLIFPTFFILDPVLSILIAIYIIRGSFSIFLESINILMQGTPKHIDIDKIIDRLKSEKNLQIIDVHHIHVWGISSEDTIFDCHIVLKEKMLTDVNKVLDEINNILSCDFNINHSTIQIETEGYDHATICKL